MRLGWEGPPVRIKGWLWGDPKSPLIHWPLYRAKVMHYTLYIRAPNPGQATFATLLELGDRLEEGARMDVDLAIRAERPHWSCR